METNKKAKALIITVILSILLINTPVTVMAKGTTNIKYKENDKLELLEIKPAHALLHIRESNILKLEMKTNELRKIKIAKKQAEEERKRLEEEKRQLEEEQRKAEEAKKQVFDGLTMEQLIDKLNRTLNSTLAGQGESFAKYSVELGIDPYLAVAIVMHETGCKWNCSKLVRTCNNVGGMKGAGGCNGGSYASFPTLDEGIKAYMNNLYKNYASQGLTTPETMASKYAASTTWASQVRSYMNEIQNN